jgi:type II secretory pathway component GspD/PulD (secretin)
MRQHLFKIAVLALMAVTVAACAASRAFTRAERAAREGDWDVAVEYYRQAVQEDPDRAEYKIAYERATFAASATHTDRARKAEEEGRLDEALKEYRRASDLDSSNRQAAAKASEIEQILRDRIEAARPRPQIERLREEAQRATPEPILSPTTPLGPVRFRDSSVRDILNFIGQSTGINVLFDRDFQDRTTTIDVEGVTLEQALQQLMLTNQLFYKVVNERTIIVAQDSTQKRQQYEDQVVRTFFLSHVDATELSALLIGIIRLPGMAIQPQFVANKTANTLTARASTPVMAIIDQMIKGVDKPRAEVILDVQILEVNRERAKQYGLQLSAYAAGLFFSPEAAPTTGTAGPSTNPFNLNTISQGVSTADFYLQLPSALVRFLESDSRTKVLAKPQLRGTEGQKVTLNLGEDVPIPSTTFTPIATGGAATNPLTSFQYRTIGIVVEMTPRVTYEGDIILDLTLENSARGGDVLIAGQALPAFSSRRVASRLRLRDGEPNLLAGLLREDERKSLTGFPGLIRMPVVQQLFGNNDSTIRQTDIVMLLTPRIVRSHGLTAKDLAPIYIGPQSNLTLGGGPPPLLAPGQEPPPEPPITVGGTPTPPPAPKPQIPPGSSPIPGTTMPPVTPPVATPTPVPTPPAAPVLPTPPPAVVTQPTPQPQLPPRDPTQPPATTPAPPATQTGGGGLITVTAPGNMAVGAGPYTVPLSISGASRISTLSLSITFNPAVLRVRSVQEGTFMRQGGVGAVFTSQPDPAGRIDIVITRPGDQTGAVGAGLLGAILFDPVAPGTTSISVTGVGTAVGTGAAAALQFTPANVTVK